MAYLNSRPIVPVSQDANDLEALIPCHFLIGRPLLQPPVTEDVRECSDSRLIIWGQQQKLVQSFWQRWKEEHLLSLQSRAKWHRSRENHGVDDIVIVLSESTPLTSWPLGRVLAIFPGDDGLVRNVDVQTATTVFKRPIQKIVDLHQPQNED